MTRRTELLLATGAVDAKWRLLHDVGAVRIRRDGLDHALFKILIARGIATVFRDGATTLDIRLARQATSTVHCPASPNVRSSASARSAPIGRADEGGAL